MILKQHIRLLLLFLTVAWLAGCSTARIAYNNADTAVRWMADDYFALAGAQEDDFKARLVKFHDWHRSEELPRYSALLASASDKLADGLTEPELQWAWDSVNARYRELAAHAAPDLAAVLVTLTPAQFDRLDKKFIESNAKYAKEHIEGSEAEQRKRRNKHNLELMREWFGDLTDRQETQLKAWGERMPLLYELRLQNRQRRQREFVALLKQYRDPAELEPRLRRWLVEWEEGATPELRRLSDVHRSQYMQMLLELDRSITPSQRAHAVARLQEYAGIFTALAEQSKLARSGP